MNLPALLIALAAAVAPAPPTPVDETPLLAWGDDPPTVEVRALSGDRTITVRYGAIDPKTFFLTLDGESMTTLFTPAPNTVETVELPFIGGRNRLLMGASSVDGARHVGLDRVIVFARLPADADKAEGDRLHSAPELRHELWKRANPEAPAPATAAPAPSTTTPPPAPTPPTGPR